MGHSGKNDILGAKLLIANKANKSFLLLKSFLEVHKYVHHVPSINRLIFVGVFPFPDNVLIKHMQATQNILTYFSLGRQLATLFMNFR